MVVMITGIDLSQEIFAIDLLRILKSSLKHRRKHVLRSLQLYGDQALAKSTGQSFSDFKLYAAVKLR